MWQFKYSSIYFFCFHDRREATVTLEMNTSDFIQKANIEYLGALLERTTLHFLKAAFVKDYQKQPLIAEIDVVGAASEAGRCNRYRDLPRMWREAEGHCLYRGAGIDCQDSGACVATSGI